MVRRLLCSLGLLAAADAIAIERKGHQLADEGEFVHRPVTWSGLEKPDAKKPLESYGGNAKHHHGAVQPFVASASEGLVGYDTYRVYLLFDEDVGKSLYAVYGDEYSALSIHTDDGTGFFNTPDPFGTDTGGVHPAMFEVKPESRFDSWLTFNQDDGENKERVTSIGIDWKPFNEQDGPLKTSDGAVFLMNPEEAPAFTGELPKEITERSKRATLLGQFTVKEGSTFTGHVNVQGKQHDGSPWQEHGVCFSIGDGCEKHPRPKHDEV